MPAFQRITGEGGMHAAGGGGRYKQIFPTPDSGACV